MDNQVKKVPAWKKTFLHHTRHGKPFTSAARLAGVGKDRIIQEKRKDPDFEKQYEAARERASERKPLQW